MSLNWYITIGLSISLIINGVFLWYIVKVLQKLSYVYDNADTLQAINKAFTDHLQAVHEMEMFYGDETLGKLIQHSVYVVEQHEIFNEIFEDFQHGIMQIIENETEEAETYAEESKKESG
tara:strand:+ start:476 stop:835 length:360 start_codon:yes stop_codon:yes gene_type:complete